MVFMIFRPLSMYLGGFCDTFSVGVLIGDVKDTVDGFYSKYMRVSLHKYAEFAAKMEYTVREVI